MNRSSRDTDLVTFGACLGVLLLGLLLLVMGAFDYDHGTCEEDELRDLNGLCVHQEHTMDFLKEGN